MSSECSAASVTQCPLSSFSMKRIMPEFRSKSDSRTLVFAMRESATAAFSASVEVPTPAFDGRNENTSSVVSISGGLALSCSERRTRESPIWLRSKGSEANSRTPVRIRFSRI